jgi:uncharacterized membrane protein YfcA
VRSLARGYARAVVWPALEAFAAGLIVAAVTTPTRVSGAVLLLPVQVSVLGVPSPAVTATNLVYNVIATPSGLLRYRASVDRLARALLVGTVPGVVVGAVIRVEWLAGERVFLAVAATVVTALAAFLLQNATKRFGPLASLSRCPTFSR